MTPTFAAVLILATSPVLTLPTAVWQVAPEVRVKADGEPAEIRVTRDRAALLVPGLQLHPLRPGKAARPELHEWAQPKAELVKALALDFDVFAFGYAQTVPVDAVASAPGLGTTVGKLKVAYREVVVIGHSAGGLVARQFAERFPRAGVTKVLQVASPNAGSELANISVGLPKPQVPFIRSLAPKPRAGAEADKLAPGIEFCCVVCKIPKVAGDSLVTLESQWPADLQAQGVPAALVAVNHFDAMKAPHAVRKLAELARGKLVRWTPEQVEAGRLVVFSKDADAAADRKRPRGSP